MVDETFDEDGYEVTGNSSWRKKSVFFKLPYWEFNLLRHNLDAMHVEKNVGENFIGTLVNVKGKSKDNPKARLDLVAMNIKHDLHPVQLPSGKVAFPPAKYAMTRKEKEDFFNILKEIKVPDGYASQISRSVDVEKRKIQFLKTHDYHILLQDLLPVALRSTMDKAITKQMIELSNIFKGIYCKTLDPTELDKLKSRTAMLLCHLERTFPPSFFTVMVHLIIHLVDEAKIAGPVQFRYMYPIERCLKVFKKYVGNKAHPEGSIAEGYIADECHTFCSRYFEGIETVFNRPGRINDINPVQRDSYLFCSGGLFKGATKTKRLDHLQWVQAHRYVLLHLDEINPYLEKFKNEKSQISRRRKHNISSSTLQRSVSEEFHMWFENHILSMGSENVSERIRCLAVGPSQVVQSYKGFHFNGIMFRTKEGNETRKSQNYGVVVTSTTPSIASSRDPNLVDGEVEYYGELIDIIELNYSGRLKVVLFECKWSDTTRGKGVKTDEFGFTLVDFTRLAHTGDHIVDDPFVIPSQVQQVFYVRDPACHPYCVAIKTTPRDMFNLGDPTTEERDDEDNNPSLARSISCEWQELEESGLVREDVNEDLLCDFVQQS